VDLHDFTNTSKERWSGFQLDNIFDETYTHSHIHAIAMYTYIYYIHTRTYNSEFSMMYYTIRRVVPVLKSTRLLDHGYI
jgi:hypothetical protein